MYWVSEGVVVCFVGSDISKILVREFSIYEVLSLLFISKWGINI